MCPFYTLSTCPSKGLCTALSVCVCVCVCVCEWMCACDGTRWLVGKQRVTVRSHRRRRERQNSLWPPCQRRCRKIRWRSDSLTLVDAPLSPGARRRLSLKMNDFRPLWRSRRLRCERTVLRSHRRRRERQSGRKSFIFNESRRRAPGESGAASFGRWERRGELKSSQLHGNELWRGSAATNRNVEVLRLRGVQRMQSCKLWFRPH